MTKEQKTFEALGLELSKSRFMSGEDLLPWFGLRYKFDELIKEFWGIGTKSTLIAATQDIDNKHWKGLVSDWNSFVEQSGQFRLNNHFVQNMLDLSLGESKKAFELKKLSKLELNLFENFFVELENFWRDYWRVKDSNAHGSMIFLVFLIETENQDLGRIAIGVPPGLVPKYATKKKPHGNIRFLAKELNVSVPLDLSVGKTRLSLHELKNIEAGDMVVFEESSTTTLIWDKDELNNIRINISLPNQNDEKWASLYYEGLEMEKMMDRERSDDILADLPIELTAQFKGVNMPLQKVMELEVGGVLPLGLLLDSELILMAPGNKPIAQGELVIVGNQFALKINKINLKSTSEDLPKAKLSAMPEINPALLEASMGSSVAPSTSHVSDEDDEDEDERMSKEDIQALGSKLDQELEDIGLDPDELDEIDDLDDDDF